MIAAIDDAAVEALGGWPPDRARLAGAIAAIEEAGPLAIAIDLLLIDPRAEDQTLAQALAAAPSVLAFGLTANPGAGQQGAMPAPVARAALSSVTLQDDTAPGHAWGSLTPAPALAVAAEGLGHVTIALDADGTLRGDLVALGYDGQFYPSLALATARLALGLSSEQVALREGPALVLGDHRLALSNDLSLAVPPYGPRGSITTVSLTQWLDEGGQPPPVDDRIVLIGATATGLGDRFASGLAPQVPGVEHIAAAVETLIGGPTRARPGWASSAEIAVLFVVALLVAAAWRPSAWLGGAVTVAALAGWFAMATLALANGIVLAVVPVGLALLAVALTSAAQAWTRERLAHRRSRAASDRLAQYVPATARGGVATDRTAHLAILFTDLVGFTTMSEAVSPSTAEARLATFHRAVETAVEEHGGTIDKFVGDGAMAVFGLSGDTARMAVSAVDAALAILAAVVEANAAIDHPNQRLRAVIGVHAGFARIGEVGGRHLRQVSVTGDTVNVASRLEEAARELDTDLVVSGPVMEAIDAFDREDLHARFEDLGPRPIRGRAQLLRLFRLAR
jgi:adenylate cyclase